MLRSFSLAPTRVKNVEQIKSLQELYHKAYYRLWRDREWVNDVFAGMSRRCSWTRREIQAFNDTHEYMLAKPTLLLPNSIYLNDGSRGWTLGVCNVQAGEPYQVQLVHDYQQANFDNLESGPLHTVIPTLASAARLVHPTNPVIAILSKPQESLALRTKADVVSAALFTIVPVVLKFAGDSIIFDNVFWRCLKVGVAAHLKAREGIPNVLYLSMKDLKSSTLGSNGDLVLGKHHLSVIYSRYDFSHPAGYFDDGDDGPASPKLWADEWDVIERIEKSTAIISSNLGSRLANRRRVHYALRRPGGFERFLSHEESAAMRRVVPEQWALHGGGHESHDLEEARALVQADPNGFVAKNVLRPRTGSDKTQNRSASGGVIVDDPEQVRRLVFGHSGAGEPAGKHFILSRRVDPVRHSALIAHNGEVVELGEACSEVATFGAFLKDADGTTLVDQLAGLGARTRPSLACHPIASELGYGAVSCVQAAD